MRLIDADAIEWGEQLVPYGNGKYEYMRIAYMDDIDDLPTVKPERKKGEWINTGSGEICSVCGEKQYGYDNLRHFCANCGAENERR